MLLLHYKCRWESKVRGSIARVFHIIAKIYSHPWRHLSTTTVCGQLGKPAEPLHGEIPFWEKVGSYNFPEERRKNDKTL